MSNITKTDGGPAFPRGIPIQRPCCSGVDEFRRVQNENNQSSGMSLRDWFAGMALASMTAAADYTKGPCNHAMAERAYLIADAMLAERLK